MKLWSPVPRGRKAHADGLTLYPIERLGNQLFSYAAVFAQARRMSIPCYVNKAFFEYVRPKRKYSYEYELDVFDSGLVVPSANAYHQPVFLGFPTFSAARLWHNRAPHFIPGASGSVFMERSFAYDPRLRAVQPGTTAIGYFQSWRYFYDFGDEIRERMLRLTKPSDWYLEMCEKIQPGTGTVGLHVRRGDYLLPEHQKWHGIATRAYYARALTHLRRMGYDGSVYLATDSPSVVREELTGLSEFTPIDPPPGTHPFEVVLILSRVDGLVIANSSFSWWAAFIGERSGRAVIAPRPWFSEMKNDTRDLLLPDWLTLDRDSYE